MGSEWTRKAAEARRAADAVLTDGYAICSNALDPGFVASLREDVARVFSEARARTGGAVPRGPERWYVEVHPEAIDGFIGHRSAPLGVLGG